MKYIIIIAFTLALNGCLPSVAFYAFNNSNFEIVFSYKGGEMLNIPAKSVGKFYKGYSEFVIVMGETTYYYDSMINFADVPDDYVNSVFPMGMELKLQFNQDGKIFILPFESEFPQYEIVNQPSRFPIIPSRVGS
ncbi:hypothetical protein [Thalassomonas sp. M1454]|uniref:hypothetical protein n=1 Tax=Thalassomonas sp. M1454 TaxID=2594477 RepID=UPI00117FA13C|nr:hypothetical protein [Thalassomonas sp. M1454]TRX55661.1 hypothetical protein FNN08_08485 [Thalassomonas sp. M1454]